MKKVFHCIFLVLLVLKVNAQPANNKDDINYLQFGLKAGAIYTSISNLSNVLVSESYYTGYTFTDEPQISYTGGVFLNFKFEESISSLYSELSYAPLNHNLNYSDVNDLNYNVRINYHYINLEIWYKAYVIKGFHFGLGPRLGFNLTPNNLFYTSNGDDLYGPDIRIQQQMRNVLKGNSNFSLGVSTGFEFKNGISLDVRYYHGLNDVITTEVNNFNFIENQNASRVFQFTLGYAFPYDLKFF